MGYGGKQIISLLHMSYRSTVSRPVVAGRLEAAACLLLSMYVRNECSDDLREWCLDLSYSPLLLDME